MAVATGVVPIAWSQSVGIFAMVYKYIVGSAAVVEVAVALADAVAATTAVGIPRQGREWYAVG